MKTLIAASVIRAILFSATAFFVAQARATIYYVNSSTGHDTNDGSSGAPWQTFTKVNALHFGAGDKLYLYGSWNQELDLQGSGSLSSPIEVNGNPPGASGPAVISRSVASGNNCIVLTDGSYWFIHGLQLANSFIGLNVTYSNGTLGSQGITLQSIYFHGNGSASHNSGDIWFFTGTTLPTSSSQWTCKDFVITNCTFDDGAWVPIRARQIDAAGASNQYCWQNFTIKNSAFLNHSFFSPLTGFTDLLFLDNYTYNVRGTGSGGSCATQMISGESCQYINNYFYDVPDTSVPDECAVLIGSFNNNAALYSNYITTTAGPAAEFQQINDTFTNTTSTFDYNTNSMIDGNVFALNSPSPGSNQPSAVLAWDTQRDTSHPLTATLQYNLYYEPSGYATNFTATFIVGGGSASLSTPHPNLQLTKNDIYNAEAGFSSTQGANQWSYTNWPGSGAQLNMSFTTTNVQWGSTSTGYWSDGSGGSVSEFDMNPDSNGANWVYRKWTAPASGVVSVRGRVLKNQTGGGDLRVCITGPTGAHLWPTSGTQTLGGSDQSGYDTHVDSVSVNAGDVISFCLNNSSGIYSNSLVSWAPTVAYSSGGP